MTVHEVSKLTGVSIRALQYYDKIGLFPPAGHTEAGYRLYDDESLARLEVILLFRELEFPLKDIKRMIESPGFDRDKALGQQIELMELRKAHLEDLIGLARKIRDKGETDMKDFGAFDNSKYEEYAERARASYSGTPEWKEYGEKSKDRTKEENAALAGGLMDIFEEFGRIRDGDPASSAAQTLVRKLKDYITENFYTCTDQALSGLGKMYAADGEFKENIDERGGEGTAGFAARAIEIFCR